MIAHSGGRQGVRRVSLATTGTSPSRRRASPVILRCPELAACGHHRIEMGRLASLGSCPAHDLVCGEGFGRFLENMTRASRQKELAL
jgi:hypothetical protein